MVSPDRYLVRTIHYRLPDLGYEQLYMNLPPMPSMPRFFATIAARLVIG